MQILDKMRADAFIYISTPLIAEARVRRMTNDATSVNHFHLHYDSCTNKTKATNLWEHVIYIIALDES